MLLLRFTGPWLVTGVVSLAICIGWRALLGETPSFVPALILTFGIGVVVGYNWPKKWSAW